MENIEKVESQIDLIAKKTPEVVSDFAASEAAREEEREAAERLFRRVVEIVKPAVRADVYALSHLSDDQPFLWAIYEHGTYLFRTTNEKLAREYVRGLGAWWRLYAWDGSKLKLIEERQ